MDATKGKYKRYLSCSSPFNVHRLELVESSEHTGTSNTSEDVGSSTLHQGHETFILANLHEAVNGVRGGYSPLLRHPVSLLFLQRVPVVRPRPRLQEVQGPGEAALQRFSTWGPRTRAELPDNETIRVGVL